MKTTLSTGASLSLSVTTATGRKADGTILSMKDWVAKHHATYGTLTKAEQKPIRESYNAMKAKALQENKAVASAIVSHEGLRVNRVAVRTSKTGKVSASISIGEKPAGKASKAIDKLAAAQVEIDRLRALIEAKGITPPAAPQTVEVPAEEMTPAAV